MNEFLVHLAPLEVEQLACVHDFLFRKVSPGKIAIPRVYKG